MCLQRRRSRGSMGFALFRYRTLRGFHSAFHQGFRSLLELFFVYIYIYIYMYVSMCKDVSIYLSIYLSVSMCVYIYIHTHKCPVGRPKINNPTSRGLVVGFLTLSRVRLKTSTGPKGSSVVI